MKFLSCVESSLGKKAKRQFEKALSNPLVEFHNRVILPQFYDLSSNSYLGVALHEFVPGRNHYVARSLDQDPTGWPGATYFTNPLAIAPAPTQDENGKDVWVSPKSRVILGKMQVFTFEFDVADLAFCDRQLGWCRSTFSPPPVTSQIAAMRCSPGPIFRAPA